MSSKLPLSSSLRTRFSVLAGVLVAVRVVAACGSGVDTSTPSDSCKQRQGQCEPAQASGSPQCPEARHYLYIDQCYCCSPIPPDQGDDDSGTTTSTGDDSGTLPTGDDSGTMTGEGGTPDAGTPVTDSGADAAD